MLIKKQETTENKPAQLVSVFEEVMINEIIPMIDTKFRTISDREHRAIAGLSMGANQTMRIASESSGQVCLLWRIQRYFKLPKFG